VVSNKKSLVSKIDHFGISGRLHVILLNKEGENFMKYLSQSIVVEDARLLGCDAVSLCISLCFKGFLCLHLEGQAVQKRQTA
jgi:hypothetical protein